jgi:hypothetical protein
MSWFGMANIFDGYDDGSLFTEQRRTVMWGGWKRY